MRKERLEELLNLAQTYRGWSRRRLAEALGRDASNLVPDSGIPKLDLVVELAKVLDWGVEDVVTVLYAADEGSSSEQTGRQFGENETESKKAHREGRYLEAIDLAKKAWETAKSNEERAISCNREASGWDGLGRYTKMLECGQRGLQLGNVTGDRRLTLQSNLATAYYCLWHLVESTAIAQTMIARYESEPPTNRVGRVVQAFAYYIRGHSQRRSLSIEETDALAIARCSKRDLSVSNQMYSELADEFGEEAYRGIANTCRGGILEAEVILGHRAVESAIEEFTEALNRLVDPAEYPVGDWLESYGWWCIFGCNVALRHVIDDRLLQTTMALLTNKADEIANRLDNWAMRERVFTMEYARRQRFSDWTGIRSDWTIDQDDLRVIAGTMGRFPMFHRIGWRILRTTQVIKEN